ncbi:hypothetical protein OF117_07850 [Geodermatophilus sp. YIM 151500]|uniref:hypothetical protein n=1 Tax=Geodermatophilus sp. YIM 151500 TaxID=2984531 RepID=UPI0021E4F049|nr:hypothetical protein [Geodermatophilus sp. YIM 151500]MCV2489276.1 hypothetical protein [Geodermatophilus sp. YIM 151500]
MAEVVHERRAGRRRAWWGWSATVLAGVLVWSVLLAPDRLFRFTPAVLLRIPLEALAVVALALVLPSRRLRVVAPVVGALLGLLTLVRILDLGFRAVLHRSFNPVTDWRLLGPAAVAVRDSAGSGWADAALAGAALVLLVLVVGVTRSVTRLCLVARRHRRATAGTLGGLGVLWLVAALLGAQLVPGAPVASHGAADLAVTQVRAAAENLRDLPVFREQLAAHDPYASVPADRLLAGLRGKDVVVVFVESYGRVAVEDPAVAPGVRAVLAAGTRSLEDAGFSARSAFLTSPTFGGVSWLAHATLQSGLWIDRQQRHDQLLASDRLTLSAAFAAAGWRTVIDVPSNRGPWPEGERFYRLDRTYNRYDVGYAGPKFGFAAMPDQYTLAAFERLELRPGHPPVMAEIDLVSAHEPWTPLPRLLDWAALGDGSVFDGMPAEGPSAAEVLGDAERLRALYGRSIEYSLDVLFSWVTTFHRDDDDLVLVLVGDHQPAEIISGPDATPDVPVTVLARDPAVVDRLAPWNWDTGMLPGPRAPVWPMDAFRDRFFAAFGSAPVPPGPSAAERPR